MAENERPFSFRGRVRRATFWMYSFCAQLLSGLAIGLLAIVPMGLLRSSAGVALAIIALAVFVAASVATCWISLATQAKRWHDRGRSAWVIILSMVPIVNIWRLVELGFLRGTRGPNKYGEDSRQPDDHACPVCGAAYGPLDVALGPSMCRRCWKVKKSAPAVAVQ